MEARISEIASLSSAIVMLLEVMSLPSTKVSSPSTFGNMAFDVSKVPLAETSMVSKRIP
jgi:hypothetical protein